MSVDGNGHGLPIRYYNLDGTEVRNNTLAPGLYIRVNGNKTEKVLVK